MTIESPEADHEAVQRRLLRRNRGLATGLLLFAAAVFIALRFVPEPGFWVQLARAASKPPSSALWPTGLP